MTWAGVLWDCAPAPQKARLVDQFETDDPSGIDAIDTNDSPTVAKMQSGSPCRPSDVAAFKRRGRFL
jgi:hypothetical protein